VRELAVENSDKAGGENGRKSKTDLRKRGNINTAINTTPYFRTTVWLL
jgi:hypothetical protein